MRNYHGVVVVEVGIGSNLEVFRELKEQAFDIRSIDISPSTEDVIKDDILNPDLEIYEGCGLIYSIRPPPELVPYIEAIAREVGADLLVRPLSTDDVPKNGKLQNYKRAFFYKISQ